MLFPTACPHCTRDFQAEFADNHIHDLTCPHCGGKCCVFVRKQKFEMLFDLGTRALMDGYAREAVASFSAALERFFEFYVKATALERAAERGGDFAGAQAALEGTWRHVASQSERQLGMLTLAYLLREGRVPDFMDARSLGSDFRNRVIHRGYLPTQAEVEAYAARVFALIDRLLTELGPAATHAELLQELTFAAHLEQLGDDVIAVFEEHPGMFRARRFGGQAQTAPKLSVPGIPANVTDPQKLKRLTALNDAQKFQQALRERGELLRVFKGAGPSLGESEKGR